MAERKQLSKRPRVFTFAFRKMYCTCLKTGIPTLSSQKVKVKVAESCPTLCNPMDSPWNSPGQNTGVGSLSISPGDLPNPRIESRSPALQVDTLQLSHKGSPRILRWVAYPFSRGSSRPRNGTGVSCFAGGFFINSAIRKPFIS